MRESAQHLERVISGRQYFTIVFGCIVGVAWMVLLGQLVQLAGPGGTAVALLVGGLLTVPVALCYAEMGSLRPAAGGELVYAYELHSHRACYATGWTLALNYVAVCVFEALSLGFVAETLFAGVQGPRIYTAFGEDVHIGGLAIALGGTLAMGVLNLLGARIAAGAQALVTYVRIGLFMLFVAIAVAYADPVNLEPWFAPSGRGGVPLAILGVLIVTPALYSGFSVMATTLEERSLGASRRVIGHAMVLGLVAAIFFYCLLVLSISALVPWAQMADMSLPAAEAFHAALGSPYVTKLVLATALLGNLTAWNGLLLAGSRVLFALGRAHFISPWFARLHPRFHTPSSAILFITLVCLAAAPLGRGFILPIVNVSSTGFAVTYLVTCLAVLRLRRIEPGLRREYRVPGGRPVIVLAIASSVAILAIALAQPLVAADFAFPIEWWVIVAWALVGALLWRLSEGIRGQLAEPERRARVIGAEVRQAAQSEECRPCPGPIGGEGIKALQ